MRIYTVIPINQIEKGNYKEKKQAKGIKRKLEQPINIYSTSNIPINIK